VPETLSERLVALAALLIAAALFALALSDREQQTVNVAAPAAPPADSGPGSPPTLAVARVPPAAPAERRPAPTPAAAQAANLVVTASRGYCWVSIRAGSADGEVLFEGILESGRTLRLKRNRLWLRLGAAANVDVSVNGKRARDLPGGTVDLLATRTGVAPSTA